MPEIITKYPEVVIQVLRESGAVCGSGNQPKILTLCPAERFCSMPTGELCVYGLGEIPKMTQITTSELKSVVPGNGWTFTTEASVFIFIALALGILIGFFLSQKREKESASQ